MTLVLYDDPIAREFEPFALTRPVSELRVGALLMRERWERATDMRATGAIVAEHVRDLDEPGVPPSVTGLVPAGAILANARCAVSPELLPAGDAWSCDGQIAAVRLAHPVDAAVLDRGALDLATLAGSDARVTQVVGWWLQSPWDLVRHLPALIEHDIECLSEAMETESGLHLTQIGPHPVYVEQGAQVEPFVLFDCQAGPVMVRRRARIAAFTRLVGPCIIGEHSQVLGGRIAASSVGDHCRVHGEMHSCILIGHANKAHDGFVGHSVFGRWSNLGAGTVTSNLKNTYGSVSVWTPQGMRDTRMQFLGTLSGDHVKTAIGTRLNTGSVIGAGANVFGDRMPPKMLPPFAWGADGGRSCELDRFLEVAARVMERRNVTLSVRTRDQLTTAFNRRWRGSVDAG